MEVLLGLAGTERNADVRAQVARAFGYRRDPRGVEPLLGWRDDPDETMRFFASVFVPLLCVAAVGRYSAPVPGSAPGADPVPAQRPSVPADRR